MSFEIVTTVSPDFADGVRLFVPSWVRNSGADRVTVHTTPDQSWYETIIMRNKNLADAVVCGRRRIVSLDVDCFVVANIASGFDGAHPIAVARWPKPNMGVAFFDGTLPFDWAGFFDPLIAKITRNCRNPMTWGTAGAKGRFGDQYQWHQALQENKQHVRRLDMREWNFCYQPEDWDEQFKQYATMARIFHVKGRGAWLDKPKIAHKIETIRRLHPERIKE